MDFQLMVNSYFFFQKYELERYIYRVSQKNHFTTISLQFCFYRYIFYFDDAFICDNRSKIANKVTL